MFVFQDKKGFDGAHFKEAYKLNLVFHDPRGTEIP